MNVTGNSKPKRKRGRPKGNREPLKSAVSFVATPEYKTWCSQFASFLGLRQVDLIEVALENLAESNNYPRPPSRTGNRPG